MSAEIEISIVIPAFQEQDVIPDTLKTTLGVLESVTKNWEIIVVDDGSSDETFSRVMSFNQDEPRIKGLRLSRRFGKEAALLAGMKRAGGQAVITMDGDLQHPPDTIPALIEAWRQGASIVHGVKKERLMGGSVHRWMARLFNRLFSRLAGFDLIGSSDFKLLDRRAVEAVVKHFPEHTRFHRGLSTWVGFQQVSVPFSVRPRPAGQTGWRLYDLIRYAWNTITAYTSLPLQLVPILGLVMLAISVILGLEAIISRLSGESVSGFATLEITILFAGSMIMIGLGIIGQYLGRMYDELKRRPIFLVDEDVGFSDQEDAS
jgi:glycosyltransferase involved in cell wall biosynthesis